MPGTRCRGARPGGMSEGDGRAAPGDALGGGLGSGQTCRPRGTSEAPPKPVTPWPPPDPASAAEQLAAPAQVSAARGCAGRPVCDVH